MTLEVTNILNGKREFLDLPGSVLSSILKDHTEGDDIYMAPGLFDLQVNGYRNIDFNNDELSLSNTEQVVVELLKDGVTRFFPTLITNDPEILEHNLNILNEAIAKNPLIKSCIPGIHLEGPFISSKAGYSGAHDKQWIRKPDWKLFEKWQKISGNHIQLITLSPEYAESIEFIKACIVNGVKVGIGHSAAGSEQIQEAVSAGATLSTHLGNAIPQNIHRHNNVLFNQLAEDNLYASIITDGHHLSESLIKIILRSKPGKVFLVSDSTKFAGMKAGVYNTVIGGKVILDENRNLSIYDNKEFQAGAASSLYQCVNFLSKSKLLPLSEAWSAASLVPHKYIYTRYSSQDNQDVVLFSYKDENIHILSGIKQNQFFSYYSN